MTDMKTFTYIKNLAPFLPVNCSFCRYLAVLNLQVLGIFSFWFYLNLLIPHAVPCQPDHSFAAIPAPTALLFLLQPLWLISKDSNRDLLPFHLQATVLVFFFLSSFASRFLFCKEIWGVFASLFSTLDI